MGEGEKLKRKGEGGGEGGVGREWEEEVSS